MGSLERKLARRQQKEIKKMEKKLVRQLSKFDSLPDNCLTCQKEYDKNNKEQAMTWKVVVRPDVVRLYCPECWAAANSIVEKIIGETNGSKNSDDQ